MNAVREMNLEEEIKALDISEEDKERILRKAGRIIDENHKQGDYLFNCHTEIDQLERAVIEQAKIIARLTEEARNKSIRCDF